MTGVVGKSNGALAAIAVGVIGEMSIGDKGEIGSTGDIFLCG